MRALAAAAVLILVALAASGSVSAQDEGAVGATIFVDPLSASLRTTPTRIQERHQATARATITNSGPSATGTVTATLLIDPAGATIVGGATRTLSSLPALTTQNVEWRLCGRTRGGYLAMAIVTASDTAGHVFRAETTAVLLEITPNRGAPSFC